MAGTVAYRIDGCAVPATGHILGADDISVLAPAVQALLRDDAGVAEAYEALVDLAETAFETTRLQEVLAPKETFEEWRVGEALAEHHLATTRGCTFPWPDARSARNPGSSGGGVDLIGFQKTDLVRFVFAEAKTSHQEAWPPSVLTSRTHGLQSQLSGLNAGDDRTRWAVKYLAMNSIGKTWHADFRSAMESYLKDFRNVVIFGVLIHVAEAKDTDLRARSAALSKELSTGTTMELIALYLSADLLRLLAGGDYIVETVP